MILPLNAHCQGHMYMVDQASAGDSTLYNPPTVIAPNIIAE